MIAHCSFQTSRLVLRMSPPVATPALLKQMSIGPSCAATPATIVFTAASSLTSAVTAMPPTSAATHCSRPVTIDNRDPGARGGKRTARGSADATRTPRDDGDLPAQLDGATPLSITLTISR